MRTWPALVLICLLGALPALGLEPYLVKDINSISEPGSSSPDNFVNLGPVALFSADDGVTGRELWRSDGTAEGTWQVADLCQPSCSGNPKSFAVVGRLYFFLAADADTFQFLWATDGTPAGTFRLTGDRIAVRDFRTRIGNILYFVAWDDAHGEELWRSDGTPAGTHIVADVRPGPDGSSPRSLTAFKGRVWFAADDGRGGGLWRSDGTAAGTVLVRDPVPQLPTNAYPESLQVVGSRLVFVAPSGNQAQALWSSDGTTQGTQPFPGVFTAAFTQFLDFSLQGSRLFFIAEDNDKGQELWVTDGTAKGTRRLTNLPLRGAFFQDPHFLALPRTSLGNRFVFAVYGRQRGVEPWITDGTVKGTRFLKEVCPGRCDSMTTTLVWDRGLPGRLFLAATDGSRGQELWVTDGTGAGTRLVRDICRGGCDSRPSFPFLLGERLVFVAANGFGRELWRTDGTAAGTVRISNFAPESPWGVFEGVVAGGQLFFLGVGPEGGELWRTDGTAAGTRLVRDINQADLGGSEPGGLMAFGNEVVFFADDGSPGLWKSDGTEAGTVRILPFEPVAANQVRSAQAAGKLLFRGRDSQLWRTDGTAAGTFQLGVRLASEILGLGGTAFFPAREGDGPVSLWASDGTVAGTRQILHGDAAPVEPLRLTAFQGKLFFTATDPDRGRELWRSDGTEAGTVLVKDIHPASGSNPTVLTVHAGRLWFFADDGEHGRELWSSDGTAAGTALAVDLEPGAASFEPSILVSLSGRLLTHGTSPSQGHGIWATDGTPAGTRMISHRTVNAHAVFQGRLYFGSYEPDFHAFLWVTDGIGIGPVFDSAFRAIPYPSRFAALDGHLVFNSAEDDVPLWVTDGTPEGTFQLLPETFPDSNGAAGELLRAGSRVFFPTFSREVGVELWAVDEAHP